MDKQDLLKMLDLSAKTDKPAHDDSAAPLAITSGETGQPTAPASATALQLDKWAVRRGREVLADNERLQASLGGTSQTAELEAADFHAAAFEPEPMLSETCTDKLRHDFMRGMLDTPEYQALHTSTCLNELASEIATLAFAEQFGTLRQKEQERKAKPKKPGKGKPADKESEEMEQEMACLGAVSKAVQQAQQDVQEAEDAQRACGTGDGGDGKMDPKRAAELFNRVRNNPQLRRICELAGRFRRLARSKQRAKVQHGYDDMVGVVMDGDVARLLPHELAQLASDDADLELDALRRLVERQSMCRQYQGKETVAKGPIVVVVDESGSMAGEKIATAKALCLAMAWIARHQKRWCALIAFSGGQKGRVLALPPNKWDEVALLDWLEAFIGKGTTADVPLVELPFTYWPKLIEQGLQRGKTDIVCITDALLQVPAEVRDRFNAWKQQERARMISLVIDEPPGDLAAVSDEVHSVSCLSTDTEAVSRVLSV